MATILAIKAHPLSEDESTSMKVFDHFLRSYQENNPQDTIEMLDLFEGSIPEIDETLLKAWNLLKTGHEFNELSLAQRTAITQFNASTEQFLAADKIVIANALWNLNIPTRLKAWIDTVNVAGKTFKYTETGPVPLTSGKKALHIQSNGGTYEGRDFSSQFVKSILNFVGVLDYHQLFIEGIDHHPEQRDEILGAALKKAETYAASF